MDQLQRLMLIAVIATAIGSACRAAPVQSEPGSVQMGIDDEEEDDMLRVNKRDEEEDDEEKSEEDVQDQGADADEKKRRRGSRTVGLYTARRQFTYSGEF